MLYPKSGLVVANAVMAALGTVEVLPAEGKGVHGINERISVKELADGIQRMVQLLKIFGGQ